MPSPDPQPTDPRPDHASPSVSTPTPDADQASTPDTDATAETTPAPDATLPTSTQENLGDSDGAGIRGDYGTASQTNGLEGGDAALNEE